MSTTGDLRQYLRGVDYPADREEVASRAEGMGAPREFVEGIRAADVKCFDSPDQVLMATQGSCGQGRQTR